MDAFKVKKFPSITKRARALCVDDALSPDDDDDDNDDNLTTGGSKLTRDSEWSAKMCHALSAIIKFCHDFNLRRVYLDEFF